MGLPHHPPSTRTHSTIKFSSQRFYFPMPGPKSETVPITDGVFLLIGFLARGTKVWVAEGQALLFGYTLIAFHVLSSWLPKLHLLSFWSGEVWFPAMESSPMFYLSMIRAMKRTRGLRLENIWGGGVSAAILSLCAIEEKEKGECILSL